MHWTLQFHISFPFLDVFSSQAIFALLKYNTERTKVTAGYFSTAPNIPSVSIFAGLTLSCDSLGWFNMMHVVAELMFSSKEVKNTALSLRHTANGRFHAAALAKLTNASLPDNPSRD